MYILLLLIIVILCYKLFLIENFQINCLYPGVKMNVKDSYESLSKGRCYYGDEESEPIDNISDEDNVSGEGCLIGQNRLSAQGSYNTNSKGFCRSACISGGDGSC